jgi:hypothetical protein
MNGPNVLEFSIGYNASETPDTSAGVSEMQRLAYCEMGGFERMRVASGLFAAGRRLLEYRFQNCADLQLHLHGKALDAQQAKELRAFIALASRPN